SGAPTVIRLLRPATDILPGRRTLHRPDRSATATDTTWAATTPATANGSIRSAPAAIAPATTITTAGTDRETSTSGFIAMRSSGDTSRDIASIGGKRGYSSYQLSVISFQFSVRTLITDD